MPTIEVRVDQIGAIASKGTARNHTVLIDRPEAKGGTDRGPMGGELMMIGLGGCFMSNLLAAIGARDAKVSGVTVRVSGTVEPNPDRITSVKMTVSAQHEDAEQMQKIITIAERACIASNTLKQAIPVSVELESAVVLDGR